MPLRHVLLRCLTALALGAAVSRVVLSLSVELDGQVRVLERGDDGAAIWTQVSPPSWGHLLGWLAGLAVAAWWVIRARSSSAEDEVPVQGGTARPRSVTLLAVLAVVVAVGIGLYALYMTLVLDAFGGRAGTVFLAGVVGVSWMAAIAYLLLVGGPRDLVGLLIGVALAAGFWLTPGLTIEVGLLLVGVALSGAFARASWRAWLSGPIVRNRRGTLESWPFPPRV